MKETASARPVVAAVIAALAPFASLSVLPALAGGCVPEGPPTVDGGAPKAQPINTSAVRAALPPKNAPTTDGGSPGDGGAAANAGDAGDAGSLAAQLADAPRITSVFEDNFDRAALGPDWNTLGPMWHIQAGKLCVRGAHNRGAWLARRLPVNARIEFEATAETPEGDLKAELWGDGMSGATERSYTNATSYVAIFGGWKNTKNVFARINEHGEGRLEIDLDKNSDDEKARPIAPGQPYHVKIERTEGRRIEVTVNGSSFFTYVDKEPLAGPGHEHFAFNDWEAPVCFDNLKVTAL